MAWVTTLETPPALCNTRWLCTYSGAKGIVYATSQDGGYNWSSPQFIDWANTRTGISCGYDASQNRFALVYEGAADENLWIVSKPVSGSWNGPYQLPPLPNRTLTPNTAFPPSIHFADNGYGSLSWLDNVEGVVAGQLLWNNGVSQYQWRSYVVKPTIGFDDTFIMGKPVSFSVPGYDNIHTTYGISLGTSGYWWNQRALVLSRTYDWYGTPIRQESLEYFGPPVDGRLWEPAGFAQSLNSGPITLLTTTRCCFSW